MKRLFCLTIIVAFVFSLCACSKQSGLTQNDTEPVSDNSESVTGAASLKELVDICNGYIEKKGDRSIIDSVLDKQMCLAINLEDDLYRNDMENAKSKADLILKGADAVQKEDPDLAAYIIDGYCSVNETDKSDLDTALDWLLKEWLYKFDDSWTDYYSPFEFESEDYNDEAEIKTYTLGSVEKQDEDSYRLQINFEIKDGIYYLVSFDYCY